MCANVLGVLAGGDFDHASLVRWAASAEVLIAADGGAHALLDAGFQPDHVIGDFDSYNPEARLGPKAIHRDENQDTTDCDKLLNLARELGVSRLFLFGVEGDRLDHVLSTLHSVAASEMDVTLVLRMGLARMVHATQTFSWTATAGAKVSVIPFVDAHIERLSGVRWPLERQRFAPAKAWSISNEALGGPIILTVTEGWVLVITEFSAEELPRWA
jgi:thiamine pyrophosphokinase